MTTQKITLNDRYDLDKSPVLLNGTQALVRLMLMHKARDTAAGLNPAGYVTGYRGSPIGAVGLIRRHLSSGPVRCSGRHVSLGGAAGGVAGRGHA